MKAVHVGQLGRFRRDDIERVAQCVRKLGIAPKLDVTAQLAQRRSATFGRRKRRFHAAGCSINAGVGDAAAKARKCRS
jgi:hypothetical protein